MVTYTKEAGCKTKNTDWAIYNMLMAEHIKATFTKIRSREKECIHGHMAKYMTVNSKMGSFMEMLKSLQQKV